MGNVYILRKKADAELQFRARVDVDKRGFALMPGEWMNLRLWPRKRLGGFGPKAGYEGRVNMCV